MDAELKLRKQIDELLVNGQDEEIKKVILSNWETVRDNNELFMIFYLLPVCEKERSAGQYTLFEKVKNTEALLERHTKLKFYLRRIEFDVMDDGMSELNEFLVQNAVSSYELLTALDYYVINKDKVLRAIQEKA